MEILFFAGGIIAGIILMRVLFNKEIVGTIKVDSSDPDSPPFLFLEIDRGKGELLQKRELITLRVDLSQK